MPRVAGFTTETGVEIRIAGVADLDGLTALLTEAFKHEPLWRWAFPDEGAVATWWRLCIGSALRYPWVWVAGDFAAASVWIAPGGVELAEDEEQRVEPLLRELVGTRTLQVAELLERFEASHPRDAPHFYLSLLGTADRHRGQGIGMALLAENLRRIKVSAADDREDTHERIEVRTVQREREGQDLGALDVDAVRLRLRRPLQSLPARRPIRPRGRRGRRIHRQPVVPAGDNRLCRHPQSDGGQHTRPATTSQPNHQHHSEHRVCAHHHRRRDRRWNYYILGGVIEVALLVAIAYYAWTWPREGPSVMNAE